MCTANRNEIVDVVSTMKHSSTAADAVNVYAAFANAISAPIKKKLYPANFANVIISHAKETRAYCAAVVSAVPAFAAHANVNLVGLVPIAHAAIQRTLALHLEVREDSQQYISFIYIIRPCDFPAPNGELCSGHGDCVCGECKCHETSDGRYSGRYCEKCPTCSGRCYEFKDCVQCQMYKKGPLSESECLANCTLFTPQSVETIVVEEEAGEHLCIFYDEDDCRFEFTYTDNYEKGVTVRAKEKLDCPPKVFMLGIVLAVIAGIVVIGLMLLLVWKLLTTIHDRQEFARFEKERQAAKWDTVGFRMRTFIANHFHSDFDPFFVSYASRARTQSINKRQQPSKIQFTAVADKPQLFKQYARQFRFFKYYNGEIYISELMCATTTTKSLVSAFFYTNMTTLHKLFEPRENLKRDKSL